VRSLRATAGRLARRFRRQAAGRWRKRDDPVRGRSRALQEEADYWDSWLRTKGGDWPDEYRRRFDPDAEVDDPALRKLLADDLHGQVSILDVGAGPATTVGRRFDRRRLVVTAVDPLAREYDRLLERHGASSPVRTEEVEGERLVERFGGKAFDIVYARNAIDHAVDPVLIVENMLAVTRPAGYVVLRHGRNEAVSEGYVQLHQWNFDSRDGRFIVWRPGRETDVSERLSGRAETRCWIEGADERDPGWLVCVIRRLPAPQPLG
jgi:SAM-dependent methyltransferase